jgi:hypothetical protein
MLSIRLSALIGLVLFIAGLFPLSPVKAGECSLPQHGSSKDCKATVSCPHSQCLMCASIQVTDARDGGQSLGCEECGPKEHCVGCATIPNCKPMLGYREKQHKRWHYLPCGLWMYQGKDGRCYPVFH